MTRQELMDLWAFLLCDHEILNTVCIIKEVLDIRENMKGDNNNEND